MTSKETIGESGTKLNHLPSVRRPCMSMKHVQVAGRTSALAIGKKATHEHEQVRVAGRTPKHFPMNKHLSENSA
eukprot:1158271-Pelagomonas_calceolata.AAC.17